MLYIKALFPEIPLGSLHLYPLPFSLIVLLSTLKQVPSEMSLAETALPSQAPKAWLASVESFMDALEKPCFRLTHARHKCQKATDAKRFEKDLTYCANPGSLGWPHSKGDRQIREAVKSHISAVEAAYLQAEKLLNPMQHQDSGLQYHLSEAVRVLRAEDKKRKAAREKKHPETADVEPLWPTSGRMWIRRFFTNRSIGGSRSSLPSSVLEQGSQGPPGDIDLTVGGTTVSSDAKRSCKCASTHGSQG